jgi:hypothetical protein
LVVALGLWGFGNVLANQAGFHHYNLSAIYPPYHIFIRHLSANA